MPQINKLYLLNRWLCIVLFMLVFSACQKSIDAPAEVMEIATRANTSKPNITPYKIERINDHNFSSQGWKEQQVNNSPIPGASQIFSDWSDYVEIVCGPENNSDPRLIQGSITMNLPTSANPTLRRVRLRRGGYSGTPIADLTELKYSTYVVHGTMTVMVLQLDVNGDATKDFNIFYSPDDVYREGMYVPVVTNTWQQWDALQGLWGVEASTIPGLPNETIMSIEQLVARFPAVRIIDTPPVGHNGEGVRFTVGGGPHPSVYFNNLSYFDALIIGTKNEQQSTLFDFMCDQSGN
jgi:hypothetical protein